MGLARTRKAALHQGRHTLIIHVALTRSRAKDDVKLEQPVGASHQRVAVTPGADRLPGARRTLVGEQRATADRHSDCVTARGGDRGADSTEKSGR